MTPSSVVPSIVRKLARSSTILILAWWIVSKSASGQVTLEFDRWTTTQGLSQVSVFSIMEDQDGYMWFTTENGLNQFDGYEFTHYTHSLHDSNSLSDQLVYATLEDSSGVMWIASFGGGLNRYDRTNGSFRHYKHDPNNPRSISSNFVTSLYQSPFFPNEIWIGTDGGGLNRFDIQRETFVTYRFDPIDTNSISSNRIYAVAGDHAGNIWIGTRSGLTLFNPNQSLFKRLTADRHGLSHDEIWHMYRDRDGVFWISTTDGLTRCDNRGNRIELTAYRHNPNDRSSLPHQRIWATCDDDSRHPDYLWVGTHQGLAHFNKKTGRCEQVYRHDPGDPRSLAHNQVWALYKDRTEHIWLGSFGGGVNRINRSKETFNHFRSGSNDHSTIRDNEIWSLYETKTGQIWVGNRKGVDVLLPDGVRAFSLDNANAESGHPKLGGSRVQAILEDREGILWLGTDGAGLYRYDPTKNILKQYRHDPNNPASLSNDFVSFVFEEKRDRGGKLWIGTNGGLNALDRATGRFVRYQVDSANARALSHNRVRCAMEDRLGGLWFGTYGGLEHLNKPSGEFTQYRHDPADPRSLSENRVWVICESRDGRIWVGTHIGLNRFDPVTRTFVVYTTREGLPSNEIYGLAEDMSGSLWISTSKGLSRFDPSTEDFTNYYEEDGLQGNEFNGAVFAKGANDRMYFGGINGFTAFYPSRVLTTSPPPIVLLTKFLKFNRPFLTDRELRKNRELELDHTDDFFGFEFAALSYHNTAKNSYKYKLEGFDNDWIASGRRRYATYTHLAPGEYLFRVMAANSDGVWNTTGASIGVVIRPPWYSTWWFRLLAAILLAGLVWLAYHIRVSSLLAVERMRVRIASDLHDDIGSTLTRIAIHSETIRTSQDIGRTTEIARKIGELSREVVMTFSDVVWSIDSRNDKFGDLVARIQDTAYQLLTPKEISFTLDVTGLDREKTIAVDIRQNLYLICKEAIHNIAKHSGANEASISMENRNGTFTMLIRDNGKGLDESQKSKGNGLKNMKMRAQRISGVLQYVQGHGLTIKFTSAEL